MRIYLCIYFLMIVVPTALQAEPTTTTIKVAAYVDVGKGQLVNDAMIGISGNKISTIESSGQATATLDWSKYYLVPGLIDTHTHLTSRADQHGYKRLGVSNTRKALAGVANARATLNSGVTSVRNLGAPAFIDVALRDAINAGDVSGPRMFVSGPALGITGGHCDNNLLPAEYQVSADGVADGPWAVAQKVRRNLKYGADLIKFCATGGVLSKGTKVGVQQYSLEEMKMIVAEAHRRGATVAAHAHGTEGINAALLAGVDSIEHASFINDEGIRLAKKNGASLSMDIYVTEYILGEGESAGILAESLEKERKVGKIQRENFRKAVAAGVKMVMGTDAGVYPHGQNLKQLSRMVEFGMTPMQALQAATINAAHVLNQSDELGAIKVGAFADMVLVAEDPTKNIATLESPLAVIKDGKIVFRAKDLGSL